MKNKIKHKLVSKYFYRQMSKDEFAVRLQLTKILEVRISTKMCIKTTETKPRYYRLFE